MQRDFISIVTPVYGDKKLVKMLYDAIVKSMSHLDVDFEIVMVCDACPYGSADEIRKLALEDKRVKFINLSRNYGQHLAIKAGLDNATNKGVGSYTVVMDCDLQDNPDDIIKFYNKIKETNADVVFGDRKQREVGGLKKLHSVLANKLIRSLSDFSIDETRNCGNFSIFKNNVLTVLQNAKEPYFVFGYLIANAGFAIEYVDIVQEERPVGHSGYNFFKGIKHMLRILVNNSNKPLLFSVVCAFIMFILCMLFILKLIIGYFVYGTSVEGWTSIMVAIFFIASLVFVHLGLMSLYIGQIFKLAQNRPLYNVRERIN